jgi:hypothetical protein
MLTANYRITYGASSGSDWGIIPVGFWDVSFAKDTEEQRSISGYSSGLYGGGMLIHWGINITLQGLADDESCLNT